MAGVDIPRAILPAHIEETIRSIERLHAEHHQNATPPQRAVHRMTALLGRPGFIGVLTILVGCWIGFNLLAPELGYHAIDPPPFAWLGSAISLVSLYMVVLILANQRHEDQLAQYREQLTLELVILGEQKTAKVIELLEEVRRDNPHIQDRVDQDAELLARPAEPTSMLDAIKETHAEAEQVGAADATESDRGHPNKTDPAKTSGASTATTGSDRHRSPGPVVTPRRPPPRPGRAGG